MKKTNNKGIKGPYPNSGAFTKDVGSVTVGFSSFANSVPTLAV